MRAYLCLHWMWSEALNWFRRKPKKLTPAELGRRGGLKSAATLMERTTPQQRQEVARNAARARWGQKAPVNGTETTIADAVIATVDGYKEENLERIRQQFLNIAEIQEDLAADCGQHGQEEMDEPSYAIACLAAAKILRHALEH